MSVRSDKSYSSTYKILVLGESGVGKTSIIRRFTESNYQESYISTIGIDSRTKIIPIGEGAEKENIRLQIWDTAGQERFRTLTSAYYRGAMGIILVYDITTDYTFASISNWLETIDQNASPGVCKILVGNKVDCGDDLRAIKEKKGRDRAKERGLEFYETSAKEAIKVDEAFMKMANMINEAKLRSKETKEIIILDRDTNNPRCC